MAQASKPGMLSVLHCLHNSSRFTNVLLCRPSVQTHCIWTLSTSVSVQKHTLAASWRRLMTGMVVPLYCTLSSSGQACYSRLQTHCRYAALMFDKPDHEDLGASALSKRHHKHSSIKYLDVYVYSFDQSLNLDTDESYTLTVGSTTIPKQSAIFHVKSWQNQQVSKHQSNLHAPKNVYKLVNDHLRRWIAPALPPPQPYWAYQVANSKSRHI